MTRGKSYQSDASIDDFMVRPGKCQNIPAMPKLPELPSVIKARRESAKTWEILGTTEKFSWTTKKPPLPYATPPFALQTHPSKKRPIINLPGADKSKYSCSLEPNTLDFFNIKNTFCCDGIAHR